MLGLEKDMSGVVGSSQNQVRAGTFPDTKVSWGRGGGHMKGLLKDWEGLSERICEIMEMNNINNMNELTVTYKTVAMF